MRSRTEISLGHSNGIYPAERNCFPNCSSPFEVAQVHRRSCTTMLWPQTNLKYPIFGNPAYTSHFCKVPNGSRMSCCSCADTHIKTRSKKIKNQRRLRGCSAFSVSPRHSCPSSALPHLPCSCPSRASSDPPLHSNTIAPPWTHSPRHNKKLSMSSWQSPTFPATKTFFPR